MTITDIDSLIATAPYMFVGLVVIIVLLALALTLVIADFLMR